MKTEVSFERKSYFQLKAAHTWGLSLVEACLAKLTITECLSSLIAGQTLRWRTSWKKTIFWGECGALRFYHVDVESFGML